MSDNLIELMKGMFGKTSKNPIYPFGGPKGPGDDDDDDPEPDLPTMSPRPKPKAVPPGGIIPPSLPPFPPKPRPKPKEPEWSGEEPLVP